MKLLIGASSSKIFHLNEFKETLEKFGHEVEVVHDIEIANAFPSRDIKKWFKPTQKIDEKIKSFRPDLILADQPKHFALEATKTNIPLLLHLRGDFWQEIEWAKETLYKSPPKRFVLKKWEEIAEKCFKNCSTILPICRYLENRTKKFYPEKSTYVFYQGISPSRWFNAEGMKLKHPCVGLLQGAVIWGKTQEILTLKTVIEKNPNITFYWAGDGPYREKIHAILKKYDNFKWLGALEYPNQVRNFLQEIDIYGLSSGIDMAPLTLLEAQLMKKPVIATNVGGIPELMQDGESGFLLSKGDHEGWNEKINLILNDQKESKKLGLEGSKFVKENFSWEKITRDFLEVISKKYQLD